MKITTQIRADGQVYDLDNQTVTDGTHTTPLHPDFVLPSDTDDSYTSAWTQDD